jgi:cytochrome c553
LLIIRALLPLLLTTGCKAPPNEVQHMPQASAVRGHAVIERAGCGACHVIPGVRWPRGRSGPSLEGFASQGLIAGRLPNRPDVLAAYVHNVPAMPMSESEARDVAAFLYTAGAR